MIGHQHSKRSSLTENKTELVLLTDFLPDLDSALARRISAFTRDQHLTYLVRDTPQPV
jgi:hypothetical protein